MFRHLTQYLCRQLLIISSIWISMTSLAQEPFPGDSAQSLICGMPYLQRMTSDGVTVMYQSTCSVHSWIEVGLDSLHVDTVRQLIDGQEVVHDAEHKIRLSSLQPGKTYYYRVCLCKIEINQPYHKEFGRKEYTPFMSFTLPTDTTSQFTFLVLNDMHSVPEVMDSLSSLARTTPHDLVIFNGDCLPEPHDRVSAIRNLQSLVQRFDAQQTPCVFLRGNHEIRGAYSSGMPSLFDYGEHSTTYHAFSWGNTRFLLLDCGEDKPDNTWVYYGLNDFTAFRRAQADFIASEINSRNYRRSRHHILVHHIPLWFGDEANDPGGCSQPCRKLWTDLLSKAKIDLALNAHTHRFEYYEPNSPVGNPYSMIIGGGPSLKSATITIVKVEKKKLTVRVLNSKGDTLFSKSL